MAFRSTARLLHSCSSHATPASLASASFKSLPKKVRIVEVGLRDGLQNEKQPIPLQTKIALLDKLYDAGLRTIEAGAFVSPKWVPQMGDTPQLFAYLREERAKGRYQGATFTALAPNAKGFEAAHSLGVEEVAIFGAVSESFTRKNSNASIEESYGRMEEIATLARRHNVRMRGYISCVMGCPYEGPVDPSAVVTAAKRLLDMGCYEISLGDTIGTGTAGATHRLLESLWSAGLPVEKFAAHFHDTYGQALSNVLVALQHGIAVVDSSVSGLGGCPYAKGASGNLSTNDLLYLLDNSGLHTGVDSGKLLQAALFIDGQLGRNSESRVVKALKAKQEKQEAKK